MKLFYTKQEKINKVINYLNSITNDNITNEIFKIMCFCYTKERQNMKSQHPMFFWINYNELIDISNEVESMLLSDHKNIVITKKYNFSNIEKDNKFEIKSYNISKIMPFLIENGYFKYVTWIMNDHDEKGQPIEKKIQDNHLVVLTIKGLRLLEMEHYMFLIECSRIKWKNFIKMVIRFKLSGLKSKIELKIPYTQTSIGVESK